MSFYENNVYYSPDKHGLTLLGEAELSEPNYSFDMIAAWKDKDGNIYLGTDSGCSCPTPFENYAGVQDLTGPLTIEEAIEESKSIYVPSYEYSYEPEAFEAFLAGIRNA